MELTIGSLFTGIGGLDLGFERAGFKVRWQVENDPYCNRVLEKHWPSVKRYGDVKEVDGKELEKVDVIVGGFPCQPVSEAGRKKGVEDERWLWPEFDRIIRCVRPRYVVVENVPGLLNLAMGEVLRDLAKSGYDAEWDCIPAAAFGAPHLRYRVFIVGYANAIRLEGLDRRLSKEISAHGSEAMANPESFRRNNGATENIGKTSRESDASSYSGKILAYSQSERLESNVGAGSSRSDGCFTEHGQIQRVVSDSSRIRGGGGDDGRFRSVEAARQARVFRQDLLRGKEADEWRAWWTVEPSVGRVASRISFRVDRLRCLGNAVVPQVAEYVAQLLLNKISAVEVR